jgi:hypothetical protein
MGQDYHEGLKETCHIVVGSSVTVSRSMGKMGESCRCVGWVGKDVLILETEEHE